MSDKYNNQALLDAANELDQAINASVADKFVDFFITEEADTRFK